MTLFTDTNNNELNADADAVDPDAGPSLDDSILDEIVNGDSSDADEGFGHLPELDNSKDEDEKETEEEEDDLLEEEEDAEDVDYDTFDDIDEM